MSEVTFTHLLNNAKEYFRAVEAGKSIRVVRNGKPIAEIIPVRTRIESWKKQTAPIKLRGLSLSEEVLKDRFGAG